MTTELKLHPLYPVLMDAIEQAMHGKGQRHGGAATPFLDQPMFHYIKMHGRGFATGQAAKKLEEAASTRHGRAFEQEVLGAIVYAASAILAERIAEKDRAEAGELELKARQALAGEIGAIRGSGLISGGVLPAQQNEQKRRSIDDATPEEWDAASRKVRGGSA